MNNQQIAETILRQLGANRFTTMTGARQFLAIERGLQFRLPSNFARDGMARHGLTQRNALALSALRCESAN